MMKQKLRGAEEKLQILNEKEMDLRRKLTFETPQPSKPQQQQQKKNNNNPIQPSTPKITFEPPQTMMGTYYKNNIPPGLKEHFCLKGEKKMFGKKTIKIRGRSFCQFFQIEMSPPAFHCGRIQN